MLRGAVTGIIDITNVLSTLDGSSFGQLIRDGVIRQVEIDLVSLVSGIVQNYIVGAGSVTVWTAIS